MDLCIDCRMGVLCVGSAMLTVAEVKNSEDDPVTIRELPELFGTLITSLCQDVFDPELNVVLFG